MRVRTMGFLLGLTLCAYPVVKNQMESVKQNETITTYQKEVVEWQEDGSQEALEQAREYNRLLYQQRNGSLEESAMLTEERYLSQCNPMGTGMMGRIEIPCIEVNLPIYHGTEESVLTKGAGHVYGTSLPVGGTNAHSILTGHRGLPSARLFTRLDELEVGDLFFVTVYAEELAYRVCDIRVIEPSDTKQLEIMEDKDLVSLITCTPYGINTHRLVVTGERVEYERETQEMVQSEKRLSLREMTFATLPFLFCGMAGVRCWRNRKVG